MDRKLASKLIDGYALDDCIALLAVCAPDLLDSLREDLATAPDDPDRALTMARNAVYLALSRESRPN